MVAVQLLKLPLTVNWNEVHKDSKLLTGTASQTFERFRQRSNYKDDRIWLLLLSVINALEKDNGRAGVINLQFEAKCGLRGSSQRHLKGQLSPAAREHEMQCISPRT